MLVPATQGSARTSSNVARFFGSISNIRPMMCLLSRGRRRNNLHGPLMTSGFTGASAPLEVFMGTSAFGGVGFDSGTASLAGVSKSLVDLDGAGVSDNLRRSVPGVGGEANNLYELSVILGIFQGNLRNDIQQ
jgi:hypothetical protein